MTEEELDAAGALAVDEDQDELMEEMSIEERKERLKKARWNVFLYLGVAAILFGFALFPMPFSAEYDDFSTSAEKDIGLVWGLPVDGEDMFDVPMRLTVTADAPPTQSAINIAVYVIEQRTAPISRSVKRCKRPREAIPIPISIKRLRAGSWLTAPTTLSSISTRATTVSSPSTLTETATKSPQGATR